MNERIISRESDPYTREALKREYKVRKFYKSLISWAGTSIMLIAIDLFTSGGITWSKFPVFFWGISIFIQFIGIMKLQHSDKNRERSRYRRYGEQSSLPGSQDDEIEDYSEDLLRDPNDPVKEKADLTEYRKLKKPWKDEDLV